MSKQNKQVIGELMSRAQENSVNKRNFYGETGTKPPVIMHICGIKDHKCNEDGQFIILKDWSTVPDTPENQEKYRADNCGWSVGCTICEGTSFHNTIQNG